MNNGGEISESCTELQKIPPTMALKVDDKKVAGRVVITAGVVPPKNKIIMPNGLIQGD